MSSVGIKAQDEREREGGRIEYGSLSGSRGAQIRLQTLLFHLSNLQKDYRKRLRIRGGCIGGW